MTGTLMVLRWRPYRRGPLLGFTKILFPSGVAISEIAIMKGPRGPWCAPPTRPKLRDGIPIRTTDGKIQQTELIEFADREIKNRWSNSIIAALRASQYHDFDSETTEEFNDE